MGRKIIALLLAIVIVSGFTPLHTYAAEITGEGYSFDSGSGTLTITSDSGTTNWKSDTGIDRTNIKKLVIENSVTAIQASAFWDCSYLVSVTIPSSIGSIGDYAFESCSSLVCATFLGSTAPILGTAVFSAVKSGFRIYYPVGGTGYTGLGYPAFNAPVGIGYSFDPATGTLTISSNRGTTSWGTTSGIPRNIVTSLVIEEGVTSIGESAFAECKYLREVELPDSLTSLGADAFDNCSALAEITIPDGVTTIPEWAFFSCQSLRSVTIPDGVTFIGDYAFTYCPLATLNLPQNLTSIGTQAFYGNQSLEALVISDKVTDIDTRAFFGCMSLKEVTFPAGVASIGNDAFAGCTALTSATFKGLSAPMFGTNVFTKYAEGGVTIYYPAGGTGYDSLGYPAVPMAPTNWQDSGTPDISWYLADPDASSFTISDADDLAGLAALVNNSAVYYDSDYMAVSSGDNSVSGSDFSGKTIYVTSNIDLSGKQWTPIGLLLDEALSAKPFCGDFEGQGYEITGLAIGSSSSYEGSFYCAGLFGITSGAVINNTGVDVEIYFSVGDSRHNFPYVGALTGLSIGGTISYCHSKGTVSVTGGDGRYLYAGGLLGWNESTVCYSYSTCSVITNGDSETIGGFAGINCGTMKYDYSTGDVVAGNDTSNSCSAYAMGGFVGDVAASCFAPYFASSDSSGEIYDCYATGNVAAGQDQFKYAGGFAGIIGINSGDGGYSPDCVIANCYYAGSASLYDGQFVFPGHFIGYDYISDATDGAGISTITNVYYDSEKNSGTYSNNIYGQNNSIGTGLSTTAMQGDTGLNISYYPGSDSTVTATTAATFLDALTGGVSSSDAAVSWTSASGCYPTFITIPAPIYGISLDETGTHTFAEQTEGYSFTASLTVTVSNTGNQATGDLTVALGGTDADSFTLSKATISSIAASGSDTFTVAPNYGLPAGTYTATVTVSGDSNITSQIFDVSFTVIAAPMNTTPARKASVPAATTASVTVNTAYILDLSTVFEDEDDDTLFYKVSVNEAADIAAVASYTYTPAWVGTITLVFKANDGTVDSTDTYTVTLTANATVPGAPQNFTATPGDGQVVLSWSAPVSDGGSSIAKYQVSGNGPTWTDVTSGTSYTFTGLTNGQSYTFEVRAVNGVGTGTAATAIATPQAAAPTDKTLVSISAPNDITGLANGTEKTDSALGLPDTVTLVTSGGNVSASVGWDVASSSYNVSSSSAQTFTVDGTVTLPAGVINPDNVPLSTSISVTVNEGSNGSGGGNNGGTHSTPSTPEYKADVGAGGGLDTTLPVTVDKNSGSAVVDVGTGSNLMSREKATVISMPTVPDVDTYTLGIPVPSLSTTGVQSTLIFNTDTGNVTVPSNMLTGVEKISGSKAQISIGQGDKDNLPDDVKATIGDRPLIQLTLSVDGKQTDWSNPNAAVTVSIPYAPSTDELAYPESIVIWYIDGSGNAISVPNGRYDPTTGTVTFSITHFSGYAVVYNKVSFNDVTAGAWYNKAVSFIAARGITGGTGNGNYSPDAKLTRGEFLVMLMKAYGIAPDTNSTNNFSDAGSKNTRNVCEFTCVNEQPSTYQ